MKMQIASSALRHAAGGYAESWRPTSDGGAVVVYADGSAREITHADLQRAARCPEVRDPSRFACECHA